MYDLIEAQNFLLIFLASFIICAVLVSAKSYHIPHTTRVADQGAVQSAHETPTPRIGGIGIVTALVGALLLGSHGDLRTPMMLFSLSLAPVFLAGLAEDIGFGTSPRARLMAAALSSVIAITLLQIWIPRSDVPGLDLLLTFTPFAVLVTVLWGTGLCHAFNLIDGLNGLAAGAGILTALGLAAIALQSGDAFLAGTVLSVVPALLGFLVLNWPFGKIFLGDAGAYSIGHVLGWLGVFVLARAENVSVFAVALVFFWPVAETFFTIYRRIRAGRRPDQPDRLHCHQLFMRGLEISLIGRGRRKVSNPLTALLMLPFMGAPVLAGVLLWDRPQLATWAMALFALAYVQTYLIGVRYTCRRARATRRARRQTAPAAEHARPVNTPSPAHTLAQTARRNTLAQSEPGFWNASAGSIVDRVAASSLKKKPHHSH